MYSALSVIRFFSYHASSVGFPSKSQILFIMDSLVNYQENILSVLMSIRNRFDHNILKSLIVRNCDHYRCNKLPIYDDKIYKNHYFVLIGICHGIWLVDWHLNEKSQWWLPIVEYLILLKFNMIWFSPNKFAFFYAWWLSKLSLSGYITGWS